MDKSFHQLSYACFLLCVFLPLPPVHGKCPQFIALSGISQSGNITSPSWPSPYPPNAICAYKLQGEAWQGVKIIFHYFDLEPPYSAGCLNDYLEVNTVDTTGQRTFRGRYCGKSPPAPILVLHPVVELVFRSNHAAHHSGFSASYEFLDESNVQAPQLNGTSPCGSVIQGIGGLIVSPGYPRGYAAGLDCLWLIRAQYNHVVYLRIQHLEFQGSTANCQKAQLRVYDGYEHSLGEGAVIKRFCGDTRFYKAEDDKYILSERNRLLIRFTTTEPSKPIFLNDTMTHVGFQLVWSDVEYMSPENCTKSSRFACQETQVCLSPHHKGTSSCPDLKHYCISGSLVCDGLSNCGEFDSSDERNCSKTPLVLTLVATPLAILTSCLFFCFLCYKRSSRKQNERRLANLSLNGTNHGKKNSSGGNNRNNRDAGGGCCCCSKLCCCCCPKPRRAKHQESSHLDEKGCRPGVFGMEGGEGLGDGQAPITRGPIYFKNELESPCASDIVSPASGFSDSESDLGNQAPIFCPAHGPVHFVPLRYLSSRHFPLLPVVQEVTSGGGGSYNPNDIYDEGGSIYSTSQNSDMIIYEDKGPNPLHLGLQQMQNQNQQSQNGENNFNMNMNHQQQQQHHMNAMKQQQQPTPPPPPPSNPNSGMSLGFVQEWRMKQLRRVQRSDAVYLSDDNKSSVASSPVAGGRICPRCLEKERSLLNHHLEPISSQNNKINSLTLSSCLLEKGNSGAQFDSGIDVVDSIMTEGGPVKNVSFETCTSSDSAISQGFHQHQHQHHPYRPRFWGLGGGNNNKQDNNASNNKFCCPPPMVEEITQTDPTTNDQPQNGNECGCGIGRFMNDMAEEEQQQQGRDSEFCETVTTFGVHPSNENGSGGGSGHVQTSKATDV